MASLLKKVWGGNRRTSGSASDQEFDRDVAQFKQTEGQMKRVYKGARKSGEALRTVSNIRRKIGHDLAPAGSSLSQNSDLKETSEKFVKGARDLALIATQLTKLEEEVVIEPMKKFMPVFPSVQRSVNRRHQKRNDLERAQAKVDKYMNKDMTSSKQATKLAVAERDFEKAKAEFERLDGQLSEDVPKLYDGRVEYLQPCLEALIKGQVFHCEMADEILVAMECELGGSDDEMDDDEVKKWMQKQLAEIKGLSVVSRND
eukprot:m.310897 g.310897  ORF g.310897 m.310897 type:complete len:259 (+) comp56248_c0_seq1:55-831(+)